MDTIETEIKRGERFEFGKNWESFLSTITDEKIEIAERSIKEMLSSEDLRGKTVLDIGCGSGLFSLAAHNLGAKVYSFDFDPVSVSCAKSMRFNYATNSNWVIEQGSILDKDFLKTLGKSFDIVYSWGVLHHTGDMWQALENAAQLVKKDGVLFIALYNDQGIRSSFWKKVKAYYCSGILGKAVISSVFVPYFFFRFLLSSALRRKNLFITYKRNRGMSVLHDWFDWLGGYPFEVAKVEEVFHFFRQRGFMLLNIKTTNTLGNNEFVFVRNPD